MPVDRLAPKAEPAKAPDQMKRGASSTPEQSGGRVEALLRAHVALVHEID